MKTPPVAFLSALIIVALLTGCESARTARIRENAAHFDSLNLRSRKLIEEGQFDLGFTSEAVFMALGKPNRIATAETDDGTVETWTYKNFLYGGTRSGALVSRGVPAPRLPRNSASANPVGPAIPSAPAQPANLEIADPPLATLLLDLRDGRVVAARLEF